MLRLFIPLLLVAGLLGGCAAPGLTGTQDPGITTETPGMPASTTAAATPAATISPATASPAPAEPTSAPAGGTIAFTGTDGNLWLLELTSGDRQQLTADAAVPQAGGGQASVEYCCGQWSSDARLLAYQRQSGEPYQDGYRYTFELWVYDVQAGQPRRLVQADGIVGFAWKPGTHLLTYAPSVAPNYFTGRGQVDPNLARGILAVEALEPGEPYELVKPEGGYSIVVPRWSPDGRFLSFDEIWLMEGRGRFAYYDFNAQAYHSFEKVLGGYDWSPDGETIAFDELAYLPSGGERIKLVDRAGQSEQPFSPVQETAYALNPVFSPDGSRLAYWLVEGGPETSDYTLVVQGLAGGEPQALGKFEQVMSLNWSGDGTRLLFSAGPYEHRQIFTVPAAGGDAQILADGAFPAWRP